jgi:hypothetical protein
MKCMVCGKGMADGVSLFRQNPKGEAGIWACRAHRRDVPDPTVERIVNAVECNYMDQPVTEAEIAAVARNHRKVRK